MRKPIAAIFLAAFAALPATSLSAAVIPPIGLAPGAHYQLVFVTSDRTDATSSTIGDYNTFVSDEAALSHSLPATSWHAVVSTSTVNANVNAPSSGLPVYNTQGIEVATAATGLYTADLVHAIDFDQFGASATALTWTGSLSNGSASAAPMGGDFVTFGDPHQSTGGRWAESVHNATSTSTVFGPLYALSGTLTVPVPEPASLALAVTACLAIGGMRMFRWRVRR